MTVVTLSGIFVLPSYRQSDNRSCFYDESVQLYYILQRILHSLLDLPYGLFAILGRAMATTIERTRFAYGGVTIMFVRCSCILPMPSQ